MTLNKIRSTNFLEIYLILVLKAYYQENKEDIQSNKMTRLFLYDYLKNRAFKAQIKEFSF